MEGILDTENIAPGKGGPSGTTTMATERISLKRPSLGITMRKKLSDITNGQQRSATESTSKDENTRPMPANAKFYIEQLQKENSTLLRVIEEKNKIIELSSLEFQKLQMNVKKVHQQNFQLAQANSHMLAELNLGKDRLKAMQHELGCTVALLRAKNLELEEKLKISHQNSSKEKKPDSCEVSQHAGDDKPSNLPNRRRQSRISSSSKSAVIQKHSAKENDNNKRICLRRRSSTSKSREPEPTEDLFEIEATKFPVHQRIDDSMLDGCLISTDYSAFVTNSETKLEKKEKDVDSTPQYQAQEPRRSSIGRPSRKAAEKVNSYKERPINVKMRRIE